MTERDDLRHALEQKAKFRQTESDVKAGLWAYFIILILGVAFWYYLIKGVLWLIGC